MNLLKALAAVSSLTLVSRILAFVRDVLIARIFGAGAATDAFFVAFKLPNLLRRLFAEGAFSQAFVPIFGEYKSRRGHDETKLLVDHGTTMLALILFVVTLVGIVAAPTAVGTLVVVGGWKPASVDALKKRSPSSKITPITGISREK